MTLVVVFKNHDGVEFQIVARRLVCGGAPKGRWVAACCCASSRIFVHESIYDEFVKRSVGVFVRATLLLS